LSNHKIEKKQEQLTDADVTAVIKEANQTAAGLD